VRSGCKAGRSYPALEMVPAGAISIERRYSDGMKLVDDALRAGHARPVATAGAARATVVVAGGGGALGSELLEQLLASRAFAHVRVLVTQPFSATVQGLEPLAADTLQGEAPSRKIADIAFVVFDRERHANGRDAAFLRPLPEELPQLAHRLHAHGVRHLVVVLPQQAALLPQALRLGLANLDEQAVASLGFEHVVFVRSAQAPSDASAGAALQRLADLVLAQLRLMTPQRQQPVRAKKVAQLAVALARALPASAPGTRVLAPEVVWQAAQMSDPEPLVRAWLAGEALPEVGAPHLRV
jgi:hypothetical protein